MRTQAAWAGGLGSGLGIDQRPLLASFDLDQLPCIALIEAGGEVLARNQVYREVSGDLGIGPCALDRLLLGASTKRPKRTERRQRFDCLMVRKGGRPLLVSGSARAIMYDGRPARLILLMERLENSGATDIGEGLLFDGLLNSFPEAVAVTFGERIFHVNDEFASLFGYTASEAIGKSLNDLIVPEDRRAEHDGLAEALRETGRATLETVRRTRAGEEIEVALLVVPLALGGGVMGQIVTYRDIREQKLADARLQYNAMHDSLTGLANRTLFLDRLRLMMARLERRSKSGFAVMFLDLDGFKQVNDSHGHAAGDVLLQEVARRLERCLRPEDTVARFGGDEFALLLAEASSLEHLAQVADRIQAEIGQLVRVGVGEDAAEVCVSASVGIAVGTAKYRMPEEILRDADFAMYAAKAAGKKQYGFFRPGVSPLRSLQLPTHRSRRKMANAGPTGRMSAS